MVAVYSSKYHFIFDAVHCNIIRKLAKNVLDGVRANAVCVCTQTEYFISMKLNGRKETTAMAHLIFDVLSKSLSTFDSQRKAKKSPINMG